MTAADTHKRLFFGIAVPASVHPLITALRANLALPASARPVPTANLHLTLAFVGPVPTDQLPKLTQLAGRVASRPFELTLDRIGYWARPKVCWLAPAVTPDRLQRLASDLTLRLGKAGFRTETRRYAPHLTLARKVTNPVTALNGQGTALTSGRFPRWRVDHFALYESTQTNQGIRYPVVQRWPLRDGGHHHR